MRQYRYHISNPFDSRSWVCSIHIETDWKLFYFFRWFSRKEFHFCPAHTNNGWAVELAVNVIIIEIKWKEKKWKWNEQRSSRTKAQSVARISVSVINIESNAQRKRKPANRINSLWVLIGGKLLSATANLCMRIYAEAHRFCSCSCSLSSCLAN